LFKPIFVFFLGGKCLIPVANGYKITGIRHDPPFNRID